MGREEAQTVSTGDSFEAFCYKRAEKWVGRWRQASDAGRVFHTDDMTTRLNNDRNDTVTRRK